MKVQPFKATDVWERLGVTEHLGGINATQRLIQLCGITPGQRVLDAGCGTGYTACLLARHNGAEVVAADLSALWRGAVYCMTFRKPGDGRIHSR